LSSLSQFNIIRPLLYFRVEFTHDYGLRANKKGIEYVFDIERDFSQDIRFREMHGKYVFIPDIENGNFLVKNDKGGYRAYQDEDLVKDGLKWKDVSPDEKKAWKWLEDLLNKIVDERHEMLDSPDRRKLSDAPSDVPEPQTQTQTQTQQTQIVQNSPIGVAQPVQNVDPVEPKLPDGQAQLISQ